MALTVHTALLKESKVGSIYLYLYILSQPGKGDIRAGAQRHGAKNKKERIKSKIGKVKKLKVMLQM